MARGEPSDAAADASAVGESVPTPPRNRKVRCKGKAVIRYKEDDGEGNRKGDPVLNEDGARTYRPCEAWAANGTDYCGNHGGSAPQVINAAKRTLALGADEFADVIRRIANDERVAPETRLKAAAQGLDRVGVRAGMDVSLETPGWQKLLGGLFGAPSTEDGGALAPNVEAEETTGEPAPAAEIAKPKRTRKAAPPPATPPAVAPPTTPPRKATKRGTTRGS